MIIFYSLPVQAVKANMIEELQRLRQKVKVGIVGGSDLNKQVEQLGSNGEVA